MTVDVVYFGFLLNYFVKKRTKKYFNSPRFKNRNNVFVDTQKNNTYHIKKNSIHMFVCLDDPSNITEICEFLKYVLKDSFFGISAEDSIYNNFEKMCSLNWTRM